MAKSLFNISFHFLLVSDYYFSFLFLFFYFLIDLSMDA